MIISNVNEILICIYFFSDKIDIEIFLKYGIEFLEKFVNGKDIKI